MKKLLGQAHDEESAKQQTSVEWLSKTLKNMKIGNDQVLISYEDLDLLTNQAKQMEKEWMLNAFQESRLTHPMIGFKHETFVDYYNETFKSE